MMRLVQITLIVLLVCCPVLRQAQGSNSFQTAPEASSLKIRLKHHHAAPSALHLVTLTITKETFSFDTGPRTPPRVKPIFSFYPGSPTPESLCSFNSFTIPITDVLSANVVDYKAGLFNFDSTGTFLNIKIRNPKNPKKPFDMKFASADSFLENNKLIEGNNSRQILQSVEVVLTHNIYLRAAQEEARARQEAERHALPAELKTTVQFDDSQSVMPTGQLEAGKKAELVVTVNNQGQGPAYDVVLVVTADNSQITAPPPSQLGEIAPGQSRQIRVPLVATLNLPGGELNVDVETKARLGGARKVRVIIPTVRLEKPALSIESMLIEDGTLGLAKGNGNKIMESGETVELIVFVKNSGAGPAAAEVSFASVDPGIEVLRRTALLGVIEPNQVAQGRLALSLPRIYAGSSATLNLRVIDRRGENVASASRQFAFSIAARAPELAINVRMISRGTEVQTLANDQTVELEITPENTGKLDAEDVAIRVSAPNVVLRLAQSEAQAAVGLLRAGEKGIPVRFTLTVPRIFLKDKLPIRVELSQKDFPGRVFAYDARVSPQQPLLNYRVNITGRFGGADIEQNETADLEVQVSNSGGLLAKDVQVMIEIAQPGVEIQGGKIAQLGIIPPAGQSVARFRIRALRSVPPGVLPAQLRILQADFSPIDKAFQLNVREEKPDVNKIEKSQPPVASPVRHKPLLALAKQYNGETVRGKQIELVGSVADQKGISHLEVSVNGKPLPEAALRQGMRRRPINTSQADDQADFSFPLALDFGPNEIRIAAFNNDNESDARVFTVTRLEDGANGLTATPTLLPLSDVDRYILSAEPVRRNLRRWAVIIGIEQYRKITSVPFANRDAYAVREYAIKILGVPAEQVFLLTDDQATKAEMLLLFEERLQQKVQSGDTVFVYFAGHGVTEVKDGTPYLVPADGPAKPSNHLLCIGRFLR